MFIEPVAQQSVSAAPGTTELRPPSILFLPCRSFWFSRTKHSGFSAVHENGCKVLGNETAGCKRTLDEFVRNGGQEYEGASGDEPPSGSITQLCVHGLKLLGFRSEVTPRWVSNNRRNGLRPDRELPEVLVRYSDSATEGAVDRPNSQNPVVLVIHPNAICTSLDTGYSNAASPSKGIQHQIRIPEGLDSGKSGTELRSESALRDNAIASR